MLLVIGIWLVLAGTVTGLAGLAGLRRTRRLRTTGHAVAAVAVPRPGGADQGRRMPFQYELADGRVLEQTVRLPKSMADARTVLIWYDPADPSDILVHGRDGRRLDQAFILLGALSALLGATIAAL